MKSWLPWIGFAISIIAIFFLINSLRIEVVVQVLTEANYSWIIPAIAASLCSFIFRAQRFRLLLQQLGHFSLFRSYQYISINYMGNNVLPARAGEALLSYVVKQRENVSFSSSLAVTVLGRVVDGLLLLICLVAALFVLPFPSWVQQLIALGFAFFGVAMILMLWLIFGAPRHHQALLRLVQRLAPSWMEKLITFLAKMARGAQQGLASLKHPGIVVQSIILTIIIWALEGAVYYLVGQAVDIQLPLMSWIFVLSLTNLASSIPSGPASIGTFEGVVVVGLSLVGASMDHAGAYALLLHATQVIPITLVGTVAYTRLVVAGKLKPAVT